MTDRPIKRFKAPSRAQIANWCGGDPDIIKAMELVFRQAGQAIPSDLEETSATISQVSLEAQTATANLETLRQSVIGGSQGFSTFSRYSMTANTTATVITAISTAVKILGTTTDDEGTANFTHTDNRAEYNGEHPGRFQVDVQIIAIGTGGDEVAICLAVNGAGISASCQTATIPVNSDPAITTGTVSLSTRYTVTLEADDYIEAWTENRTSTDDITVDTLVVTAGLLGLNVPPVEFEEFEGDNR